MQSLAICDFEVAAIRVTEVAIFLFVSVVQLFCLFGLSFGLGFIFVCCGCRVTDDNVVAAVFVSTVFVVVIV